MLSYLLIFTGTIQRGKGTDEVTRPHHVDVGIPRPFVMLPPPTSASGESCTPHGIPSGQEYECPRPSLRDSACQVHRAFGHHAVELPDCYTLVNRISGTDPLTRMWQRVHRAAHIYRGPVYMCLLSFYHSALVRTFEPRCPARPTSSDARVSCGEAYQAPRLQGPGRSAQLRLEVANQKLAHPVAPASHFPRYVVKRSPFILRIRSNR